MKFLPKLPKFSNLPTILSFITFITPDKSDKLIKNLSNKALSASALSENAHLRQVNCAFSACEQLQNSSCYTNFAFCILHFAFCILNSAFCINPSSRAFPNSDGGQGASDLWGLLGFTGGGPSVLTGDYWVVSQFPLNSPYSPLLILHFEFCINPSSRAFPPRGSA